MTTAENQKAVSLSRVQPGVTQSQSDDMPAGEEIDRSAAQSIGQIRDILFGREMTRYEKRFNHIEARLIKQTDQIKADMRNRLEKMEALVRKEADSLKDQLKFEKDQRTQQGMDLSGELKSTAAMLTQSVARLDARLKQSADSHQRRLLDQVKVLNEKIAALSDETAAALKQSSHRLQIDKVDRSTLAGLLTHLAGQLTQPAEETKSDHE